MLSKLKEHWNFIFDEYLVLERARSDPNELSLEMSMFPNLKHSMYLLLIKKQFPITNRTFIFSKKDKVWFEEIKKKKIEIEDDKLFKTLTRIKLELYPLELIAQAIFYDINT